MTPVRFRSAFLAAAVGIPLLAVVGVALVEPPLHRTPLDRTPPSGDGHRAVGVFHVHTVASDGGGTVDDLLDAARSGGLDFVVLTDHNVRGAPEWVYRDSVLLIVGEEVNTPHGHLVVAGPEPIGDRRAGPVAVEDAGGTSRARTASAVARREGLRIAAHPTGRTPWTGWAGDEFDGIEIWNADTERRNDGAVEWARAIALLPLRPLAGLFVLLDHPSKELDLWDRLLRDRPVFGICAVDAHHSLPLNRSRSLDLHFPAYRHSFAMARQHVLLERALEGSPMADGKAVLEAVEAGRSYCAFDGLADARGARFTVTSGRTRGSLGDSIPWSTRARLEVVLPQAWREDMRTEVFVLRDGRVVRRWSGAPAAEGALPGPGVYRIEVRMNRGGARVPWILTNPIWLTEPEVTDPAPGEDHAR